MRDSALPLCSGRLLAPGGPRGGEPERRAERDDSCGGRRAKQLTLPATGRCEGVGMNGRTGAVAGVALVMVLGAGAPAVRPGSAGQFGPARLGAGGIWRVVPTVSPQAAAKTQSALFGVSLTGASDGWAVGNLVTTVANPQGGPRLVVSRALAERWNGTSWQQVAMAQPATQHASPQAVADLSSNDAWAAGFIGDVAPETSSPSG